MKDMDPWKDLIIKSSENFRIDANLIRAIILTESSNQADATRYEAAWHLYNNPSTFSRKLGIPRSQEELNQATSWGLMQVMGAVARDLGFTDNLEMLKVPEIGVFYGCKKLRQLFNKYHYEEEVVSSYNQGNPRMRDGCYVNQHYVDKVYAYLNPMRVLV